MLPRWTMSASFLTPIARNISTVASASAPQKTHAHDQIIRVVVARILILIIISNLRASPSKSSPTAMAAMGMPGPWSRTRITAAELVALPCRRSVTFTAVRGLVYRIALRAVGAVLMAG